MPMCLEELIIYDCMIASELFSNVMPHLKELRMCNCRSTVSLSIGHLTFLESISISGFPELCFLEGLSSLQLRHVHLQNVPKLTAECISQFRVQKSLCVSSFDFLNHMLSAEGFKVPAFLSLQSCKEPTVSFEGSADFSSVKGLTLCNCEMESLPTNIYDCKKGPLTLDPFVLSHRDCLLRLRRPPTPSSSSGLTHRPWLWQRPRCRTADPTTPLPEPLLRLALRNHPPLQTLTSIVGRRHRRR
jgi:hypothetical protein